jgi:hypothetical protein
MRFKWGALLLVAALGWLFAAVSHLCWPVVQGSAIDTSTGQQVFYYSILDMKRVAVSTTDTEASVVIQAGPAATGKEGELLAYQSFWWYGPLPSYLLNKTGITLARPSALPRTEIDPLSVMAIENVAEYLNDFDSQKYDGIRYGFSPAGKAQLMRNTLEVLRRRRELMYINPTLIPKLMRPLDHPAGPAEVPTPEQIIRKASQFM